MAQGQIADDKIRVSYSIPKDLKDKLEKQAKKECRSVTNLIIYVLRNYVEGQK